MDDPELIVLEVPTEEGTMKLQLRSSRRADYRLSKEGFTVPDPSQSFAYLVAVLASHNENPKTKHIGAEDLAMLLPEDEDWWKGAMNAVAKLRGLEDDEDEEGPNGLGKSLPDSDASGPGST